MRHWFVRVATLVALLAMALVSGPGAVATTHAPLPAAPDITWTRALEPVIATGNTFPQLGGVPIGDLFLYTLSGASWTQIPFQVDEVDAGGTYATENGLLDANDELVFMAKDLGQQAGSSWIADADSKNYVRYEVKVTNPLSPSEQGWAYLYRSATLAPSFGDYVSWTGASQRVVAATYVVGYDKDEHVGLEALEMNGSGLDLLDRTKIRMDLTCYIEGTPFDIVATENDLVGLVWDVTPSIDGAVRVGGGNQDTSVWLYRSYYISEALMDLDSFPTDPCNPLVIHELRLSHDWLNPSTTGMAPAKYYDDNVPGGKAIDGSPDSVPALPVNEWKQTSGGRGTLVQVQEVSAAAGSISNFYRDDQNIEDPPTGDGMAFGDAGFKIASPDGQIRFALANYVLAANQPNVGSTYRSYFDNPLTVTAAAQELCWPQGVGFTYSPFPAEANVPTTFTATVRDGQQPFTYSWEFDGVPVSGQVVLHTFTTAGIHEVSLSASNACGTTESVRNVLVFADADQANLVFLPLVSRSER